MSAVAANNKTGFDASAMVVTGLLGLGALWSLISAANGADAAIRTHAWVIGAGFLVGLFMMTRIYGDGGLEVDKTHYNENIVKAGVIASLFWGVVAGLVGVIIAFAAGLAGIAVRSTGRARRSTSAACGRCTPRAA